MAHPEDPTPEKLPMDPMLCLGVFNAASIKEESDTNPPLAVVRVLRKLRISGVTVMLWLIPGMEMVDTLLSDCPGCDCGGCLGVWKALP